jgi:hypothetical protein
LNGYGKHAVQDSATLFGLTVGADWVPSFGQRWNLIVPVRITHNAAGSKDLGREQWKVQAGLGVSRLIAQRVW